MYVVGARNYRTVLIFTRERGMRKQTEISKELFMKSTWYSPKHNHPMILIVKIYASKICYVADILIFHIAMNYWRIIRFWIPQEAYLIACLGVSICYWVVC